MTVGGRLGFACAVLGALLAWPALADQEIAAADLSQLSIEQLENVEITSVSKRPEPLASAPAAVYVITHDEMVADHFITVYDAVTALRSNWLNVRPNTLTGTQEDVVIYFDATRLGGPAELRNIRVSDIDHVQHYDAVAATQRFGVGHTQGAILVSAHSSDSVH